MNVKANPSAIAARQKDGQHIDQRAMRIERKKATQAQQWRQNNVVNLKAQKGAADILFLWKGVLLAMVFIGVGVVIGGAIWFLFSLVQALTVFM